MNDRLTVVCDESDDGNRCDTVLAKKGNISRSKAQLIIDSGNCLLCGRAVKKNTKVSCGDCIEYVLPQEEPITATAQDIPIEIVYEDDDLAVVNKPKGMVVHPACGNRDNTLVNALLFKFGKLSDAGGEIRPGIVHRIDKNTSGLLIVAKTDNAHYELAKQIQAHSFTREYRAIVVGTPKQSSGTIDEPIGRSTKDRKRMAVTDIHSKNAITHYEVIKSYGKYSYVKFVLETGRTHQIRVHCAYIGHPVLGDDVYGGARKEFAELTGQCLHAAKIGFIHPSTGKYLEFRSDLPDYFKQTINKLENKFCI